MASNFFTSIFRRPLHINYYDNAVYEPVTFNSRSNLQLEDLYTSLVEVRIIEDFIGDFISRIPAGVVDANNKPIKRSPLNQLIEQSNPEQSFQELLKEFLVEYGLTGNGYMLYHNGYLYTLPSSEITAITAKSVEIPEYMNYISHYIHEYEGMDYKLSEDMVMHMKTANLKTARGTWVYGSSPYSAAEPNLKALEANYSSRVGMIQDRGAMGFVTNDSERPDRNATERAQNKMEDYGLQEGKKKFMFTSQKLRFQQMSLNVEELQLIENLDVDFTKLCNARGIDPVIFSTKDATYANQNAAYMGTVKKALLPMAYHFYDKFNLWMKATTGTTNKLVPNVDLLPDYSELGVEQSTRLVAEVREGILSRSQALDILYPDLTWEEDAPQMMQVVQANNNTGQETQEQPTEEE